MRNLWKKMKEGLAGIDRGSNFFPLPILFILWASIPRLSPGQSDSTWLEPGDQLQQVVEDFLQSTEGEGEFDYNTLLEQYEIYLKNPINLNEADETQLLEFRVLSDIQVLNLLNYRRQAGPLISIYELQAVPGFDLTTIRQIIPFVAVKSELDDYQMPVGQMLYQGANDLYIRWSRILERQKGFQPLEAGASASRYLGDPNQLYFRFRHSYSNRLSFGLTAEKDRGEEFFKGSNRLGFDFYSAHFYLRDYNKRLKAIVVGDYAVSFGQGLILFSGFGAGKGAQPINIKRTARVIRPYTSVNESDFLRGGAATIALNKNFELTALVSSRRRDARLIQPDTSELEAEFQTFSSFDIAGLHRTPSEIANRNALGQLTFGGSLKFTKGALRVAANALYDQFDKALERTPQPYNRFYFNGDRLLNAGVDYSCIFRNFNFFGETAISDNGAVATLNGLLIGLDRRVDLAILHRRFPRRYQALNANPFAETNGANNENGLYLGIEMRPLNNWKLTAYFDFWRHPWLRFRADAPSRGYEYRARLTHYLRRKLECYLEIRNEIKQTNAPDNTTKLNYLIDSRIFQTRLHFAHTVSKSLELRTRFDFGFSENEVNGRSPGIALYQDALFRPVGFPLSFTGRFSLFDTKGFQTRFYSFENDMLYSFSIPAYYHRGSRFYLNLRFKALRNLTLEWRLAQTFWSNQNTVGSGLEETGKPSRTQMGAQMKYQF
jgi:hypothetical protein